MALLEIKNCLDPVLRKMCLPIENIDGELVTLAENMVETTLAAPGVGLAANQIGLPWRMFVVNLGVETEKENLVSVINPEITAMEGSEPGEEGCLSIPDVLAEVNRATQIEIKGYDLDGNEVCYEAEGYLARAFQHEMDHLNGILFWDNIGKMKRDILKRKFKKKIKEQDA
ncbi:MAG: peptide deformylase [Nitrospina sp.]|mgnify:FL=1|jgi:peptide deformylase|nr:peptide deformylase [Nitrospina sp.]MBT3508515.1 peptide deformylase [Nitrospina sp.]MBT3875291.1 peptide deformylase [Nitrospina sp.]MBT4048624.1 peptide deformylase [Nitrospina sp.]MBT4559052.1 peptide deformylase [Nitrospina sp.]